MIAFVELGDLLIGINHRRHTATIGVPLAGGTAGKEKFYVGRLPLSGARVNGCSEYPGDEQLKCAERSRIPPDRAPNTRSPQDNGHGNPQPESRQLERHRAARGEKDLPDQPLRGDVF